MGLTRIATVELPSGGSYGHADVHQPGGRVCLANTVLEVLGGAAALLVGPASGRAWVHAL